jgi:hypothetical protein
MALSRRACGERIEAVDDVDGSEIIRALSGSIAHVPTAGRRGALIRLTPLRRTRSSVPSVLFREPAPQPGATKHNQAIQTYSDMQCQAGSLHGALSPGNTQRCILEALSRWRIGAVDLVHVSDWSTSVRCK